MMGHIRKTRMRHVLESKKDNLKTIPISRTIIHKLILKFKMLV